MAKAVMVGFRLLLRAMLFFAFYLLLADSLNEDELVAGAAIAVSTAIVSSALSPFHQAVRVRPAMFRRLPRSLLLLFTDTGRVTWALLSSVVLRRPLGGHLRVARYRATSDENPEDFGRRLLTQWGASLGANRYVLGIDKEQELLLIHELVDRPGPLDPLELG